jgi:hypothetical protein
MGSSSAVSNGHTEQTNQRSGNFFPESINLILAAVESFKHHFLMQKEIQIPKVLAVKDLHQTTMTLKAIHGSEKFVLNYQSTLSQNQKNQCL